MTRDEQQPLRIALAAFSAMRADALDAPHVLVARLAGTALDLVSLPALKEVLGELPAWVPQLAALPLVRRGDALARGLADKDREACRLVAALLLAVGPLWGAALPARGDGIIDGLAQALQSCPEPLSRLVPSLVAALHSPERADWSALRFALAPQQPSIEATIEADDEATIEDSGHAVAPTDATITTRTRAGKGARISGSPINIGGTLPPAAAPVTSTQPIESRLEIAVHGADGRYSAEARLTRAAGDAELTASHAQPAAVALDLAALRSLSLDPLAYGRRLTDDLFADPALRSFTITALRLAQASSNPLCFQIRLAASATELHALRWETLSDPETHEPLALSQQVWLARSIGGRDWTLVPPTSPRALRTLVVLAAPSDLGRYGFAPIDTARQVAVARAVSDEPKAMLTGADATLANIGAALRQGCDILYFVGHGRAIEGQTHLWLARADGRAVVVPTDELVRRVRELQQRPRLAVLTVCASAGHEDEDAIAALGPQLVAAGIPAVIAAQGNIFMDTATIFTPTLFHALRQHGQIDLAVAEARAAVREQHDWWVPTLLTSLADCRLWE